MLMRRDDASRRRFGCQVERDHQIRNRRGLRRELIGYEEVWKNHIRPRSTHDSHHVASDESSGRHRGLDKPISWIVSPFPRCRHGHGERDEKRHR